MGKYVCVHGARTMKEMQKGKRRRLLERGKKATTNLLNPFFTRATYECLLFV